MKMTSHKHRAARHGGFKDHKMDEEWGVGLSFDTDQASETGEPFALTFIMDGRFYNWSMDKEKAESIVKHFSNYLEDEPTKSVSSRQKGHL